jgi:hypothetical protein
VSTVELKAAWWLKALGLGRGWDSPFREGKMGKILSEWIADSHDDGIMMRMAMDRYDFMSFYVDGHHPNPK